MLKVRFALALTIAVAACHEPADSRAPNAQGVTTTMYGPAVQGLQMRARPLEEVVQAQGPLWVEITVRNVADSLARFRPIFNIGGLLNAEIIGPAGLPVPKTASVDPPNAWAISLQPGESVTDTMDLRCDVPKPTRAGCVAPYNLSQPGEYDVKLRFTLPCDIEPCDNIVTIEAEPFAVRVEGQDGDSDS